jgi:hypothetical protein
MDVTGRPGGRVTVAFVEGPMLASDNDLLT